ncbi:MAG: class I SAM-dependent methyltransferase [Candidatus Brocadia sp.]
MYIWNQLGQPERVLDPAAGRGEFISAIPAKERWAVDEAAYDWENHLNGVKFIKSNILKVDLKDEYFDGILVSNFLEHLLNQEQVITFLEKMYCALKRGGRIIILGPNFKYCVSQYFDCADHVLALTDVSVAEYLYVVGFCIKRVIPRFIPYSFRGMLPASQFLTRWYLRFPFLWNFLGKQFLLVAEK